MRYSIQCVRLLGSELSVDGAELSLLYIHISHANDEICCYCT